MQNTYTTQLNLNKDQEFYLNQTCEILNHIKHKIADLIIKNNKSNSKYNQFSGKQLFNKKVEFKFSKFDFSLNSTDKNNLLKKYQITGRHLNTLNIEVGGSLKSIYELRENLINDLTLQIVKIESQTTKLSEDIKLIKENNSFNQVVFTRYLNEFKIITKSNNKDNKKIINRLKLTIEENKTITKQQASLIIKYIKSSFSLNGKKKKIIYLYRRYKKQIVAKLENRIKINFGTNDLFRKQFNPDIEGLKKYHELKNKSSNKKVNKELNDKELKKLYHTQWQELWNEARNNNFYLTGAEDEIHGNQNCTAYYQANGFFTIRLRLPDGIEDKKLRENKELKLFKEQLIFKNNWLYIYDVDFGKFNPVLKDSITQHREEVIVYSDSQKKLKKEINKITYQIKKLEEKILKYNANKYIINNSKVNIIKDKIAELQNNLSVLAEKLDKDLILNPIKMRKKLSGVAISYRFMKDISRYKNHEKSARYGSWSLSFALDITQPEIITNRNLGAYGIDFNNGFISMTEINEIGKLKTSEDLPLDLQDLTSGEAQFKISQLCYALALKARQSKKPIVIEDLDFQAKKNSLKFNLDKSKKAKKYNKILSSLAYNKFYQYLKASCFKLGVELILVNPAYTSLLGAVNYQKSLGLSIHRAAAYVIARKGLGYKEKIIGKEIKDESKIEQLNFQYNKEVKYWKKCENFKECKIIVKNQVENLFLPVRNKKDDVIWPDLTDVNYIIRSFKKEKYKKTQTKCPINPFEDLKVKAISPQSGA